MAEGRQRMGFEGTQSDLCSLAEEWEDPFGLGYRQRLGNFKVVEPNPTS